MKELKALNKRTAPKSVAPEKIIRFGEEEAHVGRRMGVVLCYGEPTDDTTPLRDKAKRLAATVLGTDPYMEK